MLQNKYFLLFVLLAGIIVLMCGLLILLFPKQISAAVAWQSYSDEARTIQSDSFSEYGCYVYMKGNGLQKNKMYHCYFYDAGGYNLWTESDLSNGAGEWPSIVLGAVQTSRNPSSPAGTWRAELYNWNNQLVATDTFEVAASAIPEFSNVVSGIGAAIACGLIYWRVRK